MKPTEDEPYALNNVAERNRRLGLVNSQPHHKLGLWIDGMREEKGAEYQIPYVDPLDGGLESRILILMEAPGPKAIKSGFVSRNNPDQTAKNVCELLREAGISREAAILWNIVPWYVGDGQRIWPVRAADYVDAAPYLKELIRQLTSLRVVVLLGQKSKSGFNLTHPNYANVIYAPHPSPLALNTNPARRTEVLTALIRARELLEVD